MATRRFTFNILLFAALAFSSRAQGMQRQRTRSPFTIQEDAAWIQSRETTTAVPRVEIVGMGQEKFQEIRDFWENLSRLQELNKKQVERLIALVPTIQKQIDPADASRLRALETAQTQLEARLLELKAEEALKAVAAYEHPDEDDVAAMQAAADALAHQAASQVQQPDPQETGSDRFNNADDSVHASLATLRDNMQRYAEIAQTKSFMPRPPAELARDLYTTLVYEYVNLPARRRLAGVFPNRAENLNRIQRMQQANSSDYISELREVLQKHNQLDDAAEAELQQLATAQPVLMTFATTRQKKDIYKDVYPKAQDVEAAIEQDLDALGGFAQNLAAKATQSSLILKQMSKRGWMSRFGDALMFRGNWQQAFWAWTFVATITAVTVGAAVWGVGLAAAANQNQNSLARVESNGTPARMANAADLPYAPVSDQTLQALQQSGESESSPRASRQNQRLNSRELNRASITGAINQALDSIDEIRSEIIAGHSVDDGTLSEESLQSRLDTIDNSLRGALDLANSEGLGDEAASSQRAQGELRALNEEFGITTNRLGEANTAVKNLKSDISRIAQLVRRGENIQGATKLQTRARQAIDSLRKAADDAAAERRVRVAEIERNGARLAENGLENIENIISYYQSYPKPDLSDLLNQAREITNNDSPNADQVLQGAAQQFINSIERAAQMREEGLFKARSETELAARNRDSDRLEREALLNFRQALATSCDTKTGFAWAWCKAWEFVTNLISSALEKYEEVRGGRA